MKAQLLYNGKSVLIGGTQHHRAVQKALHRAAVTGNKDPFVLVDQILKIPIQIANHWIELLVLIAFRCHIQQVGSDCFQ